MAHGAPLTTQQKVTVVLVILIGFTTMAFGAVRMHKSINDPFRKDPSIKLRTPEEIAAERDEELKRTDTDQDGVSDYDELYVFRTSPFLPDSDSDGYDDGIEIANAQDPNCPAGRSCRQGSLSGGSAGTSASGSGVSGVPSQPGVTGDQEVAMNAMNDLFGDIADPTPEAVSARIMELSGEELRGFLEVMGIPREALDKTDDATLKAMLAETIAGAADDPEVQEKMERAEEAAAAVEEDSSAGTEG